MRRNEQLTHASEAQKAPAAAAPASAKAPASPGALAPAQVPHLQSHAGNAAAGRAIGTRRSESHAAARGADTMSLVIRGVAHNGLSAAEATNLLRRHHAAVSLAADISDDTYKLVRSNRREAPIVGAVSDALGGASLPSTELWAAARAALSQSEKALGAGDLATAAGQLDLAERSILTGRARLRAYLAGTIEGGARAEQFARMTFMFASVVVVSGTGVVAGAELAAGARAMSIASAEGRTAAAVAQVAESDAAWVADRARRAKMYADEYREAREASVAYQEMLAAEAELAEFRAAQAAAAAGKLPRP